MNDETNEFAPERKTINIGKENYYEDVLPDKVKQLIQIYSKWNTEVVEARLEVSKNEAAIRDIFREILDNVVDVPTSSQVDNVEVPPTESEAEKEA